MMCMRDVLNMTKALADGYRLRVLMTTAGGELCACQIVQDGRELRKILSMDPEELCKRQCKN